MQEIDESAYRIQECCDRVDWEQVRDTLKIVGMSYLEPIDHQKAFENSFAVVFVFHEDEMLGFGRVLSDGVYQAVLYDIAVVPKCQKMGIGTIIVQRLLQKVARCNVVLYAASGKEDFYVRFGFRRLKTGMAKFLNWQNAERGGLCDSNREET